MQLSQGTGWPAAEQRMPHVSTGNSVPLPPSPEEPSVQVMTVERWYPVMQQVAQIDTRVRYFIAGTVTGAIITILGGLF